MHLDQRPDDLSVRIGEHQVSKRRVLPGDGLQLVDGEFAPFLVDKAEAVERRREEVALGGRVPVRVVAQVDDFRVRGVDVVTFFLRGGRGQRSPSSLSRGRDSLPDIHHGHRTSELPDVDHGPTLAVDTDAAKRVSRDLSRRSLWVAKTQNVDLPAGHGFHHKGPLVSTVDLRAVL